MLLCISVKSRVIGSDMKSMVCSFPQTNSWREGPVELGLTSWIAYFSRISSDLGEGVKKATEGLVVSWLHWTLVLLKTVQMSLRSRLSSLVYNYGENNFKIVIHDPWLLLTALLASEFIERNVILTAEPRRLWQKSLASPHRRPSWARHASPWYTSCER